jgi:hypothetical protein
VSDVPETLQQLVKRRLREMGAERGRDEPLSLLEAFNAVPDPEITYELVRRVEKKGHTNIGPKAVRTIATMLGVAADDVSAAAGQRPIRGRFELPERADMLEQPEREVIVAVIDALLDASRRRQKVGHASVTELRPARPDRPESLDELAARPEFDPDKI